MKYIYIAFVICMVICGCSPKAEEPASQNDNREEVQVPAPVQSVELPNDAGTGDSAEADVDGQKYAAVEVQNQEVQAVDKPQNALPVLDNGMPSSIDEAISVSEQWFNAGRYDEALMVLYDAERLFGAVDILEKNYQSLLKRHPNLLAQPKELVPGKDISGMKRIGGGSSLVYKFLKDKEVIAAFKPFQKRFQSNYRSEIAAYRLCPLMKCGYYIPVNIPVYIEFNAFSSMYSRNSANLAEEFKEIIPTKMPDGAYRVDGTFKDWVPSYADFPIEFRDLWKKWLNPGTSKDDLKVPAEEILKFISEKHKRGVKFANKLQPHLQNISQYELARQISNLFVFDFLINNWDRFSGAPDLYGVNCQFSNGRFMSIDNGASFSQTPNPKPERNLHEISRFSRLTYEAILHWEKDEMAELLFPSASDFEKEKFETFWSQREKYLEYVKSCINKNGSEETFFFE